MHAAIAILAALLRARAHAGEGEYLDVCVADGVLSLMSLHDRRVPRDRQRPGPGSDILTGRYACYDTYAARDGRWLAVGAIEPHFYANLCKALGLERWIAHQTDDARQDEIRAALRAAFLRARPRRLGRRARARATPASRRCYSIAELVGRPAVPRARRVPARRSDPQRGRFRAARADARRHAAQPTARTACPRRARPTPTRCSRAAGYRAGARIDALRAAAQSPSADEEEACRATSDLPAEVQSWIGKERYEERDDFEVERGYVFTSCASVENGNPLFWDEKVAAGADRRPRSRRRRMLSVWFRPHHWRARPHEQARCRSRSTST